MKECRIEKTAKRKTDKGFSLIELIIVIVVMAILVAILAPQFMKHIEKSRRVRDIEDAQRIGETMETWLTDERIRLNASGGTMIGNDSPLNVTFQKTYIYVGQSTGKSSWDKVLKELNERVGVKDGELLLTKLKAQKKGSEDGEKKEYAYAVYIDGTEVSVYAVYDPGNTPEKSKEYKYQLYPNVEEGCPWDTK